MTILVLGAGGMLGHLAGCLLKEKYGSRVVLCARGKTGNAFLDQSLEILDLLDEQALRKLLERCRPCIVVNCAAINDPSQGAEALHAINARLPHSIVEILEKIKDGSRLIHISTDGVFRGDKGGYNEKDAPDSDDIYGQSKKAGEITQAPHLTVRTSIIGPDLFHSRGLLDWFLSQKQEARGFTRVYWSGVTTLEMARFIDRAIGNGFSGIYHLSSGKISKHDLLSVIKDEFWLKTLIGRDEAIVLDRSLVTLRSDIEYQVPSHRQMITELKSWMKRHPGFYEKYLSV
jgi:dTDP-4-dehydrorhamnose reductase